MFTKGRIAAMIAGLVITGGLTFSGVTFTRGEKLESLTNDIGTLITEKSALNGNINSLKGALTKLKKEAIDKLDLKEDEKEVLNGIILGLEDEIDELTSQVTDLKTSLKDKYESSDLEIKNKDAEISDLNSKLKDTQNKISQYAEKVEHLNNVINELQDKNALLTDQRDTAFATIERALNERNDALDKVEEVKTQNNNYLKEVQKQIGLLEAQVRLSNERVDSARENADKLLKKDKVDVKVVDEQVKEAVDGATLENK